MKTTFLLTIFSTIFLLSCGGKSEEEKAVDELKDLTNKVLDEIGEEWEMSGAGDYIDEYGEIMNDAMDNYDDYMENYGEMMDDYGEYYDEYMEDYGEIMNDAIENYDEYMDDAMEIYEDAYDDAMEMLEEYDYGDYNYEYY